MWIIHFCRVILLRRSIRNNNLQGSSQSCMQVSSQYLWPQTSSTGLFSRLSSYLVRIGFVGSKSDMSLFLWRFRTKSSSASYLCGRHHHHRQWLMGCHSSYSRTRPGVLIKRPWPAALFLGRGVSSYTLRSISLSTEVHLWLASLTQDGWCQSYQLAYGCFL